MFATTIVWAELRLAYYSRLILIQLKQ